MQGYACCMHAISHKNAGFCLRPEWSPREKIIIINRNRNRGSLGLGSSWGQQRDFHAIVDKGCNTQTHTHTHTHACKEFLPVSIPFFGYFSQIFRCCWNFGIAFFFFFFKFFICVHAKEPLKDEVKDAVCQARDMLHMEQGARSQSWHALQPFFVAHMTRPQIFCFLFVFLLLVFSFF